MDAVSYTGRRECKMKVLLNFNDDGTITCEDWLRAAGEIEDEAFSRGREYGEKKGYEDGLKDGRESMKNEDLKYTELDLLEREDKGYQKGEREARKKYYEMGFEEGKAGAAKACEEMTKDDIRRAREDGYTEGYLAGKKDGEKSKYMDIPDEVKKHIDEVVAWLES